MKFLQFVFNEENRNFFSVKILTDIVFFSFVLLLGMKAATITGTFIRIWNTEAEIVIIRTRSGRNENGVPPDLLCGIERVLRVPKFTKRSGCLDTIVRCLSGRSTRIRNGTISRTFEVPFVTTG